MEEQLPTPIDELLILSLFLGSITYLIGIIFIVWIMKRNMKFSWVKLLLISALLIVLGCVFSLLIWTAWDSRIDIMFGPIHLPTLISVIVMSILLLKIFGYRIVVSKKSNSKII